MILKMDTITSAHAAAAIGYGMAKKVTKTIVVDGVEQKIAIKPIFVSCRNLDVHPMTGEPTSPIDVYQQMRLQEAVSTHKLDESLFRLELRPPIEECRNWTHDQWVQFDKDCEEALQSVDKVPVYNQKTKKMEMKAVRPLDLTNAQVITTRHIDTDPHLHKIINRHTVDGGALSSHYCKLIGIVAANAIAEKYGWTRADKRQNQRKERINTDAEKVLKDMQKFSIEDYFTGMRLKGWTVDPKYDSNGNAVRYRIGEIPKGSKREVMYGASELGHSRRLMVSQLYKTWLQFHPEAQKQSIPSPAVKKPITAKPVVMPPVSGKSKKESEDERLKRERAVRQQTVKQEQTKGEKEREDAIKSGTRSIWSTFMGYMPKRALSIRDIEDEMPEAIAAKAIHDGKQQSDWCTEEGLKSAAQSLVDMVDLSAEQATTAMEGMMAAIADMVLPPVTPSSSAGGPSNNDLPKQKDDDWNWWKRGFTNKQRNGLKRK